MKKIGILTLSASDNCGSLLQAYALQTVLQDRGYDVEIIDFTTPISEKMYRIFHISHILAFHPELQFFCKMQSLIPSIRIRSGIHSASLI